MVSFVHLGSGIFNLVSRQGKFGLALILGIEEAGVPLPIPGDLILAFAGFRISIQKLTWWEAYIWSVIGVSLGSTLLYLVFRIGGRPFVYKYGKYILLPEARVHQLENWFNQRGKTAILIGRFIPGFRVFISGIAGLVNLNYLLFLPQVIVSSSLWILLFLALGYILGERWGNATEIFQRYGFIMFVVFIGTIVFSVWRQLGKSKRV